MWTPLNKADEIAQEIVALAQRDPEWAAGRILILMDWMMDAKFRKSLFEKPKKEL